MYTLLTGECEHADPSNTVQKLDISLASDLVFAVTCVKTKLSKHKLLSFAVKALTGNTEFVGAMGRPCLLFRDWGNDTAMCTQKLNMQKYDIPLPTDVYLGVFTALAWDNIVRPLETFSGQGTSHRVNVIAV